MVIIIGGKVFPFDNLRYETFMKVLGAHANIKVLATGEGWYSPETSLTAMTDILQAAKDMNAVLSNADQHLVGCRDRAGRRRLQRARPVSLGRRRRGDRHRRDPRGALGRDAGLFPGEHGRLAMEQIANAIEGKPVTQAINMDTAGPLQAMITKAVLDAHPDFKGEWAQ